MSTDQALRKLAEVASKDEKLFEALVEQSGRMIGILDIARGERLVHVMAPDVDFLLTEIRERGWYLELLHDESHNWDKDTRQHTPPSYTIEIREFDKIGKAASRIQLEHMETEFEACALALVEIIKKEETGETTPLVDK